MAYTHARLRNALALVRIATGLIFLDLCRYKISAIEYARTDFTQFIWGSMHGGAPAFYAHFLETFVWPSITKVGIMVGFLELFIGIGLTLGLLTRPVCILGMAYMLNLMLATWSQPALGEPLWTFPGEALRYAVPFCMFLLLGIGHAGENWGLGALYHRRRHKRWEKNWEIKLTEGLPSLEPRAPRPAREAKTPNRGEDA